MNGGAIALDSARSMLLGPAGLDEADIDGMLGELGVGADLADLYFERRAERSWRLEDGKVVAGSFAITQGAGARVAERTRGVCAFRRSASAGAACDRAGGPDDATPR